MSKIHFFNFIVILALLFLVACQETPDTLVSPDTEDQSVLAKPRKSGNIGINIVLNTEVTDAILAELGGFGKLLDVYEKINAVRVQAKADKLAAIQNLPYVEAANPDAERFGGPIDTVPFSNLSFGLSTWNLDAINVTAEPGYVNRVVPFDGSNVYIGILDTGLKDSWRQYFPDERIAAEYAISFGGGGMERGHVSSQPNKWEHDQNSHGTHVTSIIIGYKIGPNYVNGVAPGANIIPVKVLNQTKIGWGWSSVIARGIEYIGGLKEGPLADYPVVINMSLGGPYDALEEAMINYAIAQGVIVVGSAGNAGAYGMGYPGALEEVISVAASGWVGEWNYVPPPPPPQYYPQDWWWILDVNDPVPPVSHDFYITDFSSRELPGQYLDVAAPGSWVVGPYQMQSGQLDYWFLSGTSQAAPHVAGIVALMAEKNPALTAPQAESILEGSALPLPAGSRVINNPDGSTTTYTWGADATGAGLVDAAAALIATP